MPAPSTARAQAAPGGRRRREPEPDPRRSRRQLLLGAAIVVTALAVVLGIVGLSGGLATAPPPKPPTVEPGDKVDTGRFELTPHRAWYAEKDPTQESSYAEKGRFLVAELTVDLTAKEPLDDRSELQRGLRLELPSGSTIDGTDTKSSSRRAGSVLASDQSDAQVQPGIPRRVLAVYSLPKDEPRPASVELQVYQWKEEPGFFDRTIRWRVPLDPTVVGAVDLEVTSR